MTDADSSGERRLQDERAARLAALKAARAGGPADSPLAAASTGPERASSGPVPAAPDSTATRSPARRKPHAAAGARWLAAGVSAAATLGMVGAMGAAGAESAPEAPSTITVMVRTATPATSLGGLQGPTSDLAALDTAPAEPTYQVVAAAEPADTTSGGS